MVLLVGGGPCRMHRVFAARALDLGEWRDRRHSVSREEFGTGGEDKSFGTACRSAGDSLSFGGPCFADVNMPEELICSHNLILVGSAGSNLWLSKIQKNLPVQLEQQAEEYYAQGHALCHGPHE